MAGDNGFTVGKRLGVGDYAKVESKGHVTIGSIYSTMASLPEPKMLIAETLEEFNYVFGLDWTDHLEVKVTGSESNIKVDTCMGVMKFSTQSSGTISLGTLENVQLMIDAPNAHVQFEIKSLGDNSFIRCKSSEITVSEKIAEGSSLGIYDQTNETYK